MKSIRLKNSNQIKAADVIRAVATQPLGQQGINADDMRRRVRLLDAIERLKDDAETLLLEDADHAYLAALIVKYPFQLANRDLLTIIDDVVGAKLGPQLLPAGTVEAA